MWRIDGQVALVTGSSRGIGRGVAVALAEAGASVAVTARRHQDLDGILAELRTAGHTAIGVELDVRDTGSIGRAVEQVVQALGPIDILVNNAGMQRLRLALEVTEDDWDAVLDTNLRGAFFVAQAVGRGMVERGCGRIVNIASLAAFRAGRERAAYNSSKAGLAMLTRTLAIEWGPAGVTVNGVAPTFVETELAALTLDRPGERERVIESIPLGRLPTVADVAAAVLFLVAPASAVISGAVIPVDGGLGAT